MDTTNPANHASRRARRPLRLAAIVLSSAAAGALLVGMNAPQTTFAAPATPVVAVPWSGYADLVEQIMPAVVTVTSSHQASKEMVGEWRGQAPRGFQRGPGAQEFEDFMKRFFGERGMPFAPPHQFGPGAGRGAPVVGTGSGFIIEPDGLIVTNHHVVKGAEKVSVKLNDGREFDAQILGEDPDTDLALLKIDATDLPVVEFADSATVRVGDPVIAIGNPFGLGGTVTAGIVSAEHRAIGAGRYDDFLQIDAPINRGNSGGPTFNLQGQVIGVNTAITSPTGGNVGIGFAIPSNLVKKIVADLGDDGMVERGWLGVHIQSIDDDLAQSLGLDEAKGALVAQVTEDSPAAKAGLEQGDVILEYAGKGIDDLRDLTRAVADTNPGSAAGIVVWRDGEKQTLEVEIGQMPLGDKVVADASAGAEPDADTPKLGVMLAKLTAEARDQLGLAEGVEGVVVAEVQPGSPAAEKGIRQGDVIVEADHQPVSAPKMVAEAVRAAAERGEEAILLLVKRDGQDRFVAVRLEHA